ncbi:hypothetical protein J4471_00735 [Candidatus Woesearchaeota archaeon]|nr:hypothetical protein [Candidatus Woesearchaeota archaeon]
MAEYEEIRKLYETLKPDCFYWDIPADDLLQHKSYPLSVQLPRVLEKGATARVDLTVSFSGAETLEQRIDKIRSLDVLRDYLKECGYGPSGSSGLFGSLYEYTILFHIPIESREDVAGMFKNLSFERNMKEGK